MSFVENDDSIPPNVPPDDSSAKSGSSDESIEMTLGGSRKAIDRMIHLLHKANIIAGGDWSRPIAVKNSVKFISVASRKIQVD